MSNIPSTAVPHAKPSQEEENSSSLSNRASGLAEKARANPMVTAAAGAAVVTGLAAAAIPLVRRRGKSDGQEKAETGK